MRVVASVVLPIGLLSTTSAQISWPDCPCASVEQGCKSGTVDVSERCGCKVWTSWYDGEAFCYVADPSSCAEAQSSNLYPGAASVPCDSHAGHDHGEDGVHGGGDDGPNADGSDPDPHAGHDHGGGGDAPESSQSSGGPPKELCACAALDSNHPFTIDCSATDAIRAAKVTLDTKCGEPLEANCKGTLEGGGYSEECQVAFFILQAHHDHCAHDVLTSAEEAEVHEWEHACMQCSISRGYDDKLSDCPRVDCDDTSGVAASYYVLSTTCTKTATGCCTTEAQIGAFKTILAYHDLCPHNAMPKEVELAVHDYEHACEDHFCQIVDASYDGKTCPSPPAPPPTPPPPGPAGPAVGIQVEAVGGIVAAAAVIVLVLAACVCCLYVREKQGKPMFTNLETTNIAGTEMKGSTPAV